jgi:simple sugar transport system permease protein
MGCVLGVLLMAIIQNGLNLLGVTPFAFKAIVGVIILLAITLSNISFVELRAYLRMKRGQ